MKKVLLSMSILYKDDHARPQLPSNPTFVSLINVETLSPRNTRSGDFSAVHEALQQ